MVFMKNKDVFDDFLKNFYLSPLQSINCVILLFFSQSIWLNSLARPCSVSTSSLVPLCLVQFRFTVCCVFLLSRNRLG